jgi:hypothetical protein
MRVFKIRKGKRAVSPVVATILLISLVVAASALVYFIVVPMLRGSANVDLITIQWFDSDGDTVVDVAYVTLQNSGTASATINQLNVTIDTTTTNTTIIDNAVVEGIELPLTVDPAERIDLVVSYDPANFVEVGENVFRIKIVYDNDLQAITPENMKHISYIEPLDFTVLNPIDGSWVSGILDPQALATGGYRTSIITYDFALPNGTVVMQNQTVASNIDTTIYPDDTDYDITFFVDDALGDSAQVTRTFNIDNNAVGVDLSINSTIINPGDFLGVSWSLSAAGAQLVNQTLVLGGNVYPFESVFTSKTDAVTSYVLPGSQTNVMAEDDLSFTIFVKDAAGNTNSSGQAFSLIDNLAPVTYFITPANDTSLSEIITIEIYADDATGIDTNRFDVYFFGYATGYFYLYQQSVKGEAVYVANQKKWTLDFNTYLLPDDNYSIIAQVYDLASAGNGASATIDIVEIDNEVIEIYGAVATNGRGGFFFRRRGLLTFYVESKVPTVITITQMRITWYGNSRIDNIYDIYDDTIEQYWLPNSAGPIADDAVFPVAQATGGINMTSALDHHLTIQFDWADRPETVIFGISFYIEQLSAWETIIIDTV